MFLVCSKFPNKKEPKIKAQTNTSGSSCVSFNLQNHCSRSWYCFQKTYFYYFNINTMDCYIINYDLRNARDYDKLYDAIKSYGTYAHILESTWAIVTSKKASEVRNYLEKYIDKDDGIFVIKSGTEAAWRKVICRDKWLKDHL